MLETVNKSKVWSLQFRPYVIERQREDCGSTHGEMELRGGAGELKIWPEDQLGHFSVRGGTVIGDGYEHEGG